VGVAVLVGMGVAVLTGVAVLVGAAVGVTALVGAAVGIAVLTGVGSSVAVAVLAALLTGVDVTATVTWTVVSPWQAAAPRSRVIETNRLNTWSCIVFSPHVNLFLSVKQKLPRRIGHVGNFWIGQVASFVFVA
jgi:hypothetical protein